MVEGPFVYQSNNFMVESFTSPLVSYEASKMELRITHFSTFTLLEGANPAYFGVRNPAPKTRSLLKPKPTPITNVYDDLVVELLDIRSQIPMPKPWQGRVAPWAATETNFETRAHLRISRNGMPDTTWHPINAAVFDDLGNGYSQSLYYPPGTDGIDVVGGFSPLETRRFRFEFYKDGPFQPDESLKFENVAVPKANGRPLAATNSLRGFAVSYLFVNTNMFNSRITPEPVGYRTYIKIEPAGSNGKLAPIIQGVCMSWQSTGLAIPEGVTAIDITFTISENRYFEFVTRPSSIGTNLGITR
jgi:hypothetical protein